MTNDNTNNKSPEIVLVSEILPDKLTVLPVQPRPVFPHLALPLVFSGERFVKAIQHAFENENRLLGISLIREENKEDYALSDIYEVGTVMKIFRVVPVNDYTVQIIAQGVKRFRKVRDIDSQDLIRWEVRYFEEEEIPSPNDEQKAYLLAIMSSVKELIKINSVIQEQLKLLFSQLNYEKPHMMLDLVSSMLSSDAHKLQDLLEIQSFQLRAERLLILLREEIELFQLQSKIQKQIDEKVNKQQKEFFLREQLKAIKKELGLEKDEKASQIEKFEARLKNLHLTPEASRVIQEELDKLQLLEPHSSEYHVSRAYLEALTDLPWGLFSTDNTDLPKARKILDDEHYGLDDVKKAILEFISTIAKRGELTGTILCLVGPPGVGKTSVGRSIANALGRQFFRFSVGGMHDEAEIKGHRRTYIGAMHGKIMQSLKRCATANPVLMIDEIDKIGTSYKGDPASALLEVLDPEQNKEFLDHYLDVRFDLSKILFITTANQLDTIPPPLLDRMEIIRLSGYILEEKLEIAKRYLVPKQLKEHGLTAKEAIFTDNALEYIIDNYAREAGVRNLEKLIRKIMRKITLRQAEEKKKAFRITMQTVPFYLGQPLFSTEHLYVRNTPGVALGLAWTASGGATLYIEASGVKSKAGGFKQTGQLGNVMQESAQIAYTYVRSIVSGNENTVQFFEDHHIHLHVPAGATPKDGPSAGITMALALFSLAVGQAVKNNLAMTGELTLTGKVLPIGGVKEKTIAARRVGITELIFPKDNQKDFDELPEHLRKDLKVQFVDYFDEVIKTAYSMDE